MAGVKIIRAIPGSTTLGPILADFCRREGVVTSFSDSLLYAIRGLVDEDSPARIESFGKVVREFLALCGEPALYIAPKAHRRSAIALACQSLAEDSPFYRSREFPGAHAAIANALDYLEDFGIGESELLDLAGRSSPDLASKLASLVQISHTSGRVMSDLGRQTSGEQIGACLSAIPERDGTFARLLIFAGGEIPPLKVQWIEWAARNGTAVTVVLDRHASDAELFSQADVAEQALGGKVTTMGEGNQLLKSLFTGEVKSGAPLAVSILEAGDPLGECEWALRECLNHPEESATIYVRNLDAYASLLDAASARLGVPIKMPRRAPLLTNGFARLTLATLDFCTGRDVRRLEPILRSSYVGLDANGRAAMSAELLACYRLRDGAWTRLEGFAASHRDSIPWLAELLEWRRKANSEYHAPRTWLGLLMELTRADEVMPWSTRSMQAEPFMRERDIRARNRMEQLVGDELSVLNMADPSPRSLRWLTKLCRELWTDADVSIPPGEGKVAITDSSDAILDANTLYVLGMLEGVFPRRRSEDPVLTDSDLAEISRLAGVVIPDSHVRALGERDEFYRVCAAAGNRLRVSYPRTDDQRDNIPAFYLAELEQSCGKGGCQRQFRSRIDLCPPIDECVAESDRQLRLALDGSRADPLPNQLVTEAGRQVANVSPNAALHPRELEDALQCPFKGFVRHRMRLAPNRPTSRWFSLSGVAEAGGLFEEPDEESARQRLQAELDRQLDSLYAEIPEWEMQALRSGGRRLITEWVAREFAARKTWQRQEGSVQVGAEFGGDLRSDLPRGVKLRGSVPAVSKIGPYRVAHMIQSRVLKDPSDGDRLAYGMHMLALYDADAKHSALEIETLSGQRVFLVAGRLPGFRPEKYSGSDLKIVELGRGDDATSAAKQFFTEVKDSLGEARRVIASGSVEAKPGPHCAVCDFGELCRRSNEFGEVISFLGELEESESEEFE